MLFAALVNPTLIPYRIYQPKRACNLPIPANPPVNKLELSLARYLWGFCENETSRETNLARDFSRD